MEPFKHFFQWYLGLPQAEPGESTAWSLHYDFPYFSSIPAWAVVVGLAAAVTGVWWIYRHDGRLLSFRARLVLVGLRLACLALLLVLLSGAALSVERTGLPVLVILVDDSASMSLEDRYDEAELRDAVEKLAEAAPQQGRSRLDVAQGMLLQDDAMLLRRLLEDHKLRVYRFSEEIVPLAPGEVRHAENLDQLLDSLREVQSDGQETLPGPAVRQVFDELRGTLPSAVVLLTDGVATSEGARLSGAIGMAETNYVPLFCIGIGSEDPTRDIQLYDLLADPVAFVEDPITFTAQVKAPGYEGEEITISLKEGNRVLAESSITVPAEGQPLPVQVTHAPSEEGEFDYTLEAAPREDEINRTNNAETRQVSVRRERIRVLLADSAPRYEFRYLKHLLERDRSIELSTVLQTADVEYAAEDETALDYFPVRHSELLKYDVIIFGDLNPDYFTSRVLSNLRDFVSDAGGGLIVVAGPHFNPLAYAGTPLESLLPVSLEEARWPPASGSIREGFRPEFTAQGRQGTELFQFGESGSESNQIWKRLPELYWLFRAPELKPGAVALATHPYRAGATGGLPVIAMQRYGAGKVLFHATDELWRWRFRVGDLYYGRYWIQAIRELSRSKLLGSDRSAELATDRLTYEMGETVNLRLRFLNDGPHSDQLAAATVVVERDDGISQPVELSRTAPTSDVFEGSFLASAAGSYHVWVAEPSYDEAPPSVDFQVRTPERELDSRRVDRAELVRAADETRGRYYTPSDYRRLPQDIPTGRPVPLEALDPVPLWNRPELLLLFALLLTGEWVLRKRHRLI